MSTAAEGIGRLGTGPVEGSMESLCAVTGCSSPELAVAIGILLLTAVFFLLAGSVLAQLWDARDAVKTEEKRAKAEKEAFERFRRVVAGLEPGRPSTPEPGGQATAGGVGPPTNGGTSTAPQPESNREASGSDIAVVRKAYRETVMATPHYDSEYDETLVEHIAEEFTPGVAGAVAAGGALTPGLQSALVSGAAAARDRRAVLLEDLDQERASISEAIETLEPAAEAVTELEDAQTERASYADLEADWERLDWHETRVSDLLSRRQDQVREHAADGADPEPWFEYLYEPLRVRYPILATGTDVIDRLRRHKNDLAGELGRRG